VRSRGLIITGLAALLLAPEQSAGQQPQLKIPRIGILSMADRTSTKIFDAFRDGLRNLGYIDGQNITIEYRLAAGDFSRLPAIAGELVRLPVDVIVVDGGTKVAQIAQAASSTIPIVGALGPDPVAAGLAASLGHPGGNVTGHGSFAVGLSGKRVQLLKEAFPGISRIAALSSPADPLSNRRRYRRDGPHPRRSAPHDRSCHPGRHPLRVLGGGGGQRRGARILAQSDVLEPSGAHCRPRRAVSAAGYLPRTRIRG
jgi:ABC-type uncharacterized transport system substrate-binding protein